MCDNRDIKLSTKHTYLNYLSLTFTHHVVPQMTLPIIFEEEKHGGIEVHLEISTVFKFSKLLSTDVFRYSWAWYYVL